MFERRLGLFPAFFEKNGDFHVYTGFGDFPFKVPNKKINGPADIFPNWMLLSYKKPVTVSSELPNHSAANAGDEDIRTYWSAKTGDKGEWLTMDLQKAENVNAVQINFAENDTKLFGRTEKAYYQYLLEYSLDNKTWKTLADKTGSQTDVPHDYLELKAPVKARYLRLTNYHMPSGTFALADLRVFGKGEGALPPATKNFKVERQADRCVVNLSWTKTPGVTGVNIRYGTAKDKLYQVYQTMDTDHLTIRSLDAGQKYYFTVDAFNENGVRKGTVIKEVE